MTTIPKPVLDIIKRVAGKALWSDEDSRWGDVINGDKFITLLPENVLAAREFLASEAERNRMIPAVAHSNEAFIPLPAMAAIADGLGLYDPDRAAEDHRQLCEGEGVCAYHVRVVQEQRSPPDGRSLRDKPDLAELVRLSVEAVKRMSPEEKEAMFKAQRESWARSCITNPDDRQGVYHKAEVAEPLSPAEVEAVRRILLRPPVVSEPTIELSGCTTVEQAEAYMRRQREAMVEAVNLRHYGGGHGQ